MVPANSPTPLRIAVDLTPLLACGSNGGVKPFIFQYIGWLARQSIRPLQFVFLTRQSSHGEVRTLARPVDELVCIFPDIPDEEGIPEPSTLFNEKIWLHPPQDLLLLLEADVLYSPFGYWMRYSPEVPIVATIVDVLHRDYPLTLSAPECEQREKAFQEIIGKAQIIQVISDYTKERVIHHYGFDPGKIFRSYIAIHHRLQNDFPAIAPAGPKKNYFLFPANAWKHKNHPILLLAFNIYRQRTGPAAWDLVLTGQESEDMRAVLRLAETLGLSDSVRFLGHLQEKDFSAVWQNAGALVFPSLHEGFGIPLVEAMSFDLPIIASKTTSLPEVGGDACVYIDPLKPLDLAGAMEQVATDEALREKLKRLGEKRLGEFSFEKDAMLLLENLISCAQLKPKTSAKSSPLTRLRSWIRRWTPFKKPVHLPVRPLKISVIVPSFNQAKFLAANLDSILNQGYPNLEVRVYDGGSTDGSKEILENHPGQFWWRSEKDGGQAAAINEGIRESSGEILAFLNSDDIYFPGTLAKVADYFSRHPECSVLYGDAHHLHADGSFMEDYYTESWNYERLQEICYICQPAVFWRRSVVDRFGPLDGSLHFSMDYDYWLRLGREIPFHYLKNTVLAGSRLHEDTKTLSQRSKVHREILETVIRNRCSSKAISIWMHHLSFYEASEVADPHAKTPEKGKEWAAAFSRAVLKNADAYGVQLPPDKQKEYQLNAASNL